MFDSNKDVCAGCGRPSYLMICPECEAKSRNVMVSNGHGGKWGFACFIVGLIIGLLIGD